ncbi:MAG: hypothetical protein GC192_07920 [Bacteroidetes bacterium]|nr:hypothetical protein [Bacteroidota bacterium]
MKTGFTILLIVCCGFLYAQDAKVLVQGAASYVSSQNVYVKYATTEGIEKGDTLFTQKDSVLTPSLVVKDKSSTSCVCSSLLAEKVNVGEVFFAKILKKEEPKKAEKESKTIPQKTTRDSLAGPAPVVVTPETEEKTTADFKQKIRGRVSASSYSNFYAGDETHRMRYAFTMQGNNIKNSRFSTDTYITFRHTVGEWQAVKDKLSDALKVYSMALKYDLDKTSNIVLGRRINQRISSMGAIDGLQVEKGLGNFMLGGIIGSRPNYADYGFDFSLLQAGAYIGYNSLKDSKQSQSTAAFIEQRNSGAVDRRFLYFQHSNNLLKDLSFFGSAEVDLYENINGEAKSKASLTNMYLSLRQKISKKTSLSLSYDNRKNIIYYESYKNYIDQLIDDETRQGLRFNFNYRPFKLITWGINASWRFQKSDANLSKNLNSYLNISRIPWMKTSASITANFLETHYLSSKMYGLRLTRDIVPGKLSADVYARMVDYRYTTSELRIQQEILGVNLSWNLTKKLALYLYYEGTFDKKADTFHRVNTKLVQRF